MGVRAKGGPRKSLMSHCDELFRNISQRSGVDDIPADTPLAGHHTHGPSASFLSLAPDASQNEMTKIWLVNFSIFWIMFSWKATTMVQWQAAYRCGIGV